MRPSLGTRVQAKGDTVRAWDGNLTRLQIIGAGRCAAGLRRDEGGTKRPQDFGAKPRKGNSRGRRGSQIHKKRRSWPGYWTKLSPWRCSKSRDHWVAGKRITLASEKIGWVQKEKRLQHSAIKKIVAAIANLPSWSY